MCAFRLLCPSSSPSSLPLTLAGGADGADGEAPLISLWLSWEIFDMMMLFPSMEWHKEHVLQHHPHTKRFGEDPDEILDPFRLCASTPWTPVHLFQVIPLKCTAAQLPSELVLRSTS